MQGFDEPSTDCCFFFSATNSITYASQCMGRAIRLNRQNPRKVAKVYVVCFDSEVSGEDIGAEMERDPDGELAQTARSILQTTADASGIPMAPTVDQERFDLIRKLASVLSSQTSAAPYVVKAFFHTYDDAGKSHGPVGRSSAGDEDDEGAGKKARKRGGGGGGAATDLLECLVLQCGDGAQQPFADALFLSETDTKKLRGCIDRLILLENGADDQVSDVLVAVTHCSCGGPAPPSVRPRGWCATAPRSPIATCFTRTPRSVTNVARVICA